jgi:hypothetical protein
VLPWRGRAGFQEVEQQRVHQAAKLEAFAILNTTTALFVQNEPGGGSGWPRVGPTGWPR